MRAASLLGVFLTARVLLLFDREVPVSAWTVPAYLWQDLLVVLLFAAVDLVVRRSWPGWILYSLVAVYAAINLPLARVTSSPLTWPMLRAARETLADSIAHHLTPGNLFLMFLVLVPAVGLPFLMRKVKGRALRVASVLALPVLVAGPYSTSRIETRGLHRNVVIALLGSAFPRVPSRTVEREWRASPFPAQPGDDLTRLRGGAAGRHVLLVLLESAGAQYLAPYGAAEDPMPNLSALARKAILFENAYAVYPESIKGLFSVLFSLSPAFDTKPTVHAKVVCPTLAALLSTAGYRTGLFHSGRFMYLGMDSILRNRGFHTLEDAGDIGGNRNSSFGIDEPATVKRILSWIDGLPRGERFFITYLPIAGHHPYETPERGPFPEQEEIGRYRNALHYADAALGDLLSGLRERGIERDTLLFIMGDHGEAFHQHEGNYGHTFFLYEENLRVPYLVVMPGLIEEEVRVRRIASLLDTAPTILDLLGLRAPEVYQGRSLLERAPRMALFFTDYSLGFLGLRDGRWKFIHEIESGRSRLFDLSTDPLEKEDLSGKFQRQVEAYRQHLLDWCASQRDFIQTSGQEADSPPTTTRD